MEYMKYMEYMEYPQMFVILGDLRRLLQCPLHCILKNVVRSSLVGWRPSLLAFLRI